MMIHDWARKQADKNPDNIAVTLSSRHLSYGRLESESNKLAGMLLASGLKTGDRVGLLTDKSPESIIAMHGISKAGGVYVPLDIHSPKEHSARIIETSELSFIMIDKPAFGIFMSMVKANQQFKKMTWIWWTNQECPAGRKENFGFSYRDSNNQVDFPYQKNQNEDSPAYLLFNSNIASKPEGIVTTHKNIETFINWGVSYFDIQVGDRVSGHSPLHSDLSAFDVFGTLAAGAHLYMIPASMSLMPKQLSHFIIENDLTQWFSEPSVLTYMARFKAIPKEGFPGLKRLIWCGDVIPAPVLKYWMKQLPDVNFTNLYGPPEATIGSAYFTLPDIPKTSEEIPIGTACGGEKLLVLDENLKPVQEGRIGDLYIAGDGLSAGYWKDLKKTEEAFCYSVFGKKQERVYKTGDLASRGHNGLIYYHGRSDFDDENRGRLGQIVNLSRNQHGNGRINKKSLMEAFELWN